MALDGRFVTRQDGSVLWRSTHHRPAHPHRLPLRRQVKTVPVLYIPISDCNSKAFVSISFKPEDVTVRLGEYDFSQVSEARRDFAAESIFMHESYDRKTYRNDIALIKLKEKATFNDDIWPICLPPSNIVLEGQSAFVTG